MCALKGVLVMQAFLGVVAGVGLGFALVKVLGAQMDPASPSTKPSALSWTALVLGCVALLMVTAGLLAPVLAESGALSFVPAMPAVLSIVFSVASLVAIVGALAKRDRHWMTWIALAAAVIPVLFWVAFLIGEVVSPHG